MKKTRSLIACLLCSTLSMLADTLITSEGKLQGLLTEFEKSTFTFMEFDRGEPTKIPLSDVSRINLSKPTKTNFFLDAHAKKPTVGVLRAFRKGNFYVILDGKKKKLSPRYLTKFTISISLRDFQLARDARQETEEQPARKAKAYAQKGVVTIVHFHDDSAASKRQGNLCQRLAKDDEKNLAYVRVNAPLDSKVAKLNNLSSTPQFWFFTRNGKLGQKLVERFTEEDITELAQKLVRQR